jgi:phosphate uptake regulator
MNRKMTREELIENLKKLFADKELMKFLDTEDTPEQSMKDIEESDRDLDESYGDLVRELEDRVNKAKAELAKKAKK